MYVSDFSSVRFILNVFIFQQKRLEEIVEMYRRFWCSGLYSSSCHHASTPQLAENEYGWYVPNTPPARMWTKIGATTCRRCVFNIQSLYGLCLAFCCQQITYSEYAVPLILNSFSYGVACTTLLMCCVIALLCVGAEWQTSV